MSSNNRIQNEIDHAKYLLKHGPSKIWNWDSNAGKIRWKRRADMLCSEITENSEVLELGCGAEYLTKELIKCNCNITAIDISEDLINYAKKNVVSPNLRFLIQNAYSMDFEDATYDFIVGSSVLHHLDIDKAISKIFRVLKPNGKIFFTEPNMLNPQIAIQKNIPFIKKIARRFA